MMARIKTHLRELRPTPWQLRLFPGDSRTFGPPRRRAPGLELTAEEAEVRALPLERVRLAEARWIGPPKLEWLGSAPPCPNPRAFVLRAPSARLLAPDGSVVVGRDTWLTDCGFYPWSDEHEAFRYHPLFKRKKSRPLRRWAGRTLALVGDYTAFSYGHWLIDAITRWHLVRAAGLDADAFDQVYLPCPGPVARRLAERLPIPSAKLITERAADDLCCEELTATSHPGWPGFVPAFAAELLRGLLPAAASNASAGPRRIAILRDGFSRNFANRDELYALLARRGFALLDPRRDEDIPARCAAADAIVSIEGSQAYDLLFARPGTRVLIITSPHHTTFPYPQSAAGAAGLELFMLAGRPASTAPQPLDTPFVVPAADFAAALDVLLANTPD